jgi:methylmalonyl-CoA mutase, N-terminal domain
VVRTAFQAMAAVLGGAQSLHTNSLDEAYALPSEQAVTLALRTQQILAYETGVPQTPDPLGGSYFLERATLDIEAGANEYIEHIDQLGGMIPAIEAGFPQAEISAASYRYQCEIEAGKRIIVGVNRFESADEPIELLQMDQSAGGKQREKLKNLRARRDNGAVDRTLADLSRAAENNGKNTMPFLIEAVRAYDTLGEICDALRRVFGVYTETNHV